MFHGKTKERKKERVPHKNSTPKAKATNQTLLLCETDF